MPNENLAKVKEMLKNSNLSYAGVAKTTDKQAVNIFHFNETVFSDTLQNLFNTWSDVSYKVQRLRDNIETAESERKTNQEFQKFLTPDIKFDIPPAQKKLFGKKPKIALLREQGINGHYDMAAALMAAGFEVHDVHMSQIATKINCLLYTSPSPRDVP